MLTSIYSRWSRYSPEQRFRLTSVAGCIGLLFVCFLAIGLVAQQQRIKKLVARQDDFFLKIEKTTASLESIQEDGKSAVVAQELRQLREEVIRYRAEQQGRDQILGLSTGLGLSALTDPLASLSNTLDSLDSTSYSSSSGGIATDLTTSSTTSPPQEGSHLGTISLLEGKSWTSVDAFEQPLSSSKIVGQLVVRVSYPYFSKDKGWYETRLSNGKRGWVQEQFVKEE